MGRRRQRFLRGGLVFVATSLFALLSAELALRAQSDLTLGFTYSLGKTTELTMAYMHAFENSVSGPATNPYFNVGGTETLTMSEDALGIAFGW